MISRRNKKGLDCHGLVSENVFNILKRKRPEVYKSLLERALDGSHPHQKLFSQLVGDIQSGSNHNIHVNVQNNIRFPVARSNELPSDLIELESDT